MADNSNLAEGQTHAGRAGELERDAADALDHKTEASDRRAIAFAALAQSHRLAVVADVGDAIHDRLDDIKSRLP